MTNCNRIGEACWFRKHSVNKWETGILRMWTQDFEELESGKSLAYPQYPIVMVEDDATKRCHKILIENICFSSDPYLVK